MKEQFGFEVWQEGMRMAACFSTDRDQAMGEAFHYFKVYRQDGPAEIKERIGRKRVTIALSGTSGMR